MFPCCDVASTPTTQQGVGAIPGVCNSKNACGTRPGLALDQQRVMRLAPRRRFVGKTGALELSTFPVTESIRVFVALNTQMD